MQNVRKSIVLLMMVRNEEHVIERALMSALPHVDHVVIVDTGSTDKTREVAFETVERFHKGITFINTPWFDFGSNRTSALAFAKGVVQEELLTSLDETYFLLLDADDQVLDMPVLTNMASADVYTAIAHSGTMRYAQPKLLRGSTAFKWVGRTHEMLVIDEGRDCVTKKLEGFKYLVGTDSSRRKSGEKLTGDLELLRQDLRESPNDTRTLFYLAETWRALQKFDSAAGVYARCLKQHRADKTAATSEEYYLALLGLGQCSIMLRQTPEAIVLGLAAINARPHRPEAYAALAKLYELEKQYVVAMMFATEGATKTGEGDHVFVDPAAQVECKRIRDRISDRALNDKGKEQAS